MIPGVERRGGRILGAAEPAGDGDRAEVAGVDVADRGGPAEGVVGEARGRRARPRWRSRGPRSPATSSQPISALGEVRRVREGDLAGEGAARLLLDRPGAEAASAPRRRRRRRSGARRPTAAAARRRSAKRRWRGRPRTAGNPPCRCGRRVSRSVSMRGPRRSCQRLRGRVAEDEDRSGSSGGAAGSSVQPRRRATRDRAVRSRGRRS